MLNEIHMSLTKSQIDLVTESWQRVVPIQETIAKLFYHRLFELDSNLKHLFKGDIQSQGKKLMQMLGVVVNSLNCLNEIQPSIQAMGRRHAHYGVKTEDYSTVARSLLWSLEHELGDTFTKEVREAWTTVYTLVANTMLEAAAEKLN